MADYSPIQINDSVKASFWAKVSIGAQMETCRRHPRAG